MDALIEVLGLPGAGKSTVTRAVADAGSMAVLTDWSGPPSRFRLPMPVQLFLSAPVLSVSAFLAVGTRRGLRPVHLRRVYSVQRRHIVLRGLGRPALVLDEGPLHSLFVAMYGTRETRVSRFFLGLLVALLARGVDRYLYLDVPKDDCIANFRRPGRTSVRFNANSTDEVVEYFRADTTYEEILRALTRAAPAKLISVDSAMEARAWLLR